MPDEPVLKLLSKRLGRGRYSVTLMNGDTVIVAGNINPHKATDIDGFITSAITAAPVLELQKDFLRNELLQLARPQVKPKQEIQTSKTKIEITGSMMEAIIPTMRVLAKSNTPPRLFVRIGQLSRIATDEKMKRTIAPISEAWLRGELARHIEYFQFNQFAAREDAKLPPAEIVKDILARDINTELAAIEEKAMPGLTGITEVPIIRIDGSILSTEGYDSASGMFYIPPEGSIIPTVQDNPTKDDIAQAVAFVHEPICDFPFESQADRANAVGLMLTPLIRSIVPTAPAAAIDAPVMGSGKSLIARVISIIAIGRDGDMASWPSADDELRKLITSALIAGTPILILDNCEGTLSAPSFARYVTAAQWTDRILGGNRIVTVPQITTTILTGNNIGFGGDLIRRVYRIRINTCSSRPWQDSREFKHPDLIEWTLLNRGRLVAALLTLARGWYAAGKPDLGAVKLGSFEAWSFIVGNVLRFAGIKGFLDNLDQLYEQSDDETPQWEGFLSAWFNHYGSEAIPVSRIEADLPIVESIRDALPEAFQLFVERKVGQFSAVEYRVTEGGKFKIRLGKALQKRKDRRFGNPSLYFKRHEDSHTKRISWSVIPTDSAVGAGSIRSVSYSEKSGTSEHVHDVRIYAYEDGLGTLREPTAPTANPEDEEFDTAEREAIASGGM